MRRHTLRRRMSAATAFVLTSVVALSGLQVVSAPPAGAATPTLLATSSADPAVFPGAATNVNLRISNTQGGATAYNLTAAVVLPAGVSYVPGSSTPTTAVGDPTGYPDLTNPNPATRTTTLVWSNITDLNYQGSLRFSFQVKADPTLFPVGSQFTLHLAGFGNSDPRYVPKFNTATNSMDPTTYDAESVAPDTTTKVVPFLVSKAEPSPQGEIMRGIHPTKTTPTTYRIKVTENSVAGSNNVTVVDYLPAQMEYLGCGGPGVDNSVVNNPEYNYLGPTPPAGPGPDLNQLPSLGSACTSPTTITTTNTEAPPGVTPGAVYTKITWNVGTLAAGQVLNLTFYSGAPIRANTMNWAQPGGGTTTTPPSGALVQGVNLDNNNGAYTTQTATPIVVTNTAVASGDYTGPEAPGVPTFFQTTGSASDKLMDLSIIKSANPTTFQIGQLNTYTLHIRTSEYRTSHAIVVTDTIPNGMCPVDATTNYSQYTGKTATPDPACAATAGAAPSLPFSSVVQNSDGTYTVTWNVPDQNVGSTFDITYKARALSLYAGTTGALSGLPTAAGDTFNNTVGIAGATDPAVSGAAPGDINIDVSGGSSATLTTAQPTILKQVSAPAASGTLNCTASGVTWLHPTATPDTRPVYHLGDRVCFRLTVNFPASVSTRDATVNDFLPASVTYENGSLTTSFAGSQNSGIPNSQINATTSPQQLSIKLGATSYTSGHTYVSAGSTFDVVFSAIVTSDASVGNLYDVPGNLMKFGDFSSAGTSASLRDAVDFKIGAAPRIDLADAKTIASINGVAQPAGTKSAQARAGDVVGFNVVLTNNGVQAAGDVQAWDALPPGWTCATVSLISDGGTCTNGVVTSVGTASVIKWTLPGANVIPGTSSHAPLTYSVTVPAGVSFGTAYINTLGLRTYTTLTNTGSTSSFCPTSNIDPNLSIAGCIAATPAISTATLNTPGATVVKTNTTSVTEAGNATVGQATVGEGVTWTVTTTIPHGSTVYGGVLTDTLPTGVTVAFGASSVLVNGVPNPAFVVTTAQPSTVTVTFPSTYTVGPNAADSIITLTVPVTVADNATAVSRGKVLTNKAKLTASADPSLGSNGIAPTAVLATNGVTVVEPNLTLTKVDDTTNHIVVPGQGVNYTLTLKNVTASNVSVAHNVVVTDVVPAGMDVSAPTVTPAATSLVVDPVTHITTITWNVGDVAPGAALTFKYLATVDLTASSANQYTNTVSATSSSLATGGRTTGSAYNPSASDTVTVEIPTVTKAVTPGSATIGDTVKYTLTVTIPPSVNVPNATLLDTAPAGLTNITPLSATCVQAGGSCNEFTGSVLTANPVKPLVHGWYLGDFTGAGSVSSGIGVPRVITLTYSAQVANIVSNVAGASLVNSAQIYWNKVSTGNPVTSVPTAPGVTYDYNTQPVTAKLTVIEPNVSIVKSVDRTLLGPGDVAGYTLTVSNATGTNASPAYNVSVSDKVPSGLVVDAASISNGGTLDTTTNTITWTVAGPLAPGASTVLTYKASLAPSPTLTTNQVLNNSAAVASYTGVAGGAAAGGRLYVGNTSTASVTAVFPKLVITKAKISPTGSTVEINQPTQWQVVVTNTGGAPASGLSVADVLPPNWSYTAGTGQVQGPSGSTTTTDPTVVPSASGDTLTWSGLPNLQPNQSDTISYTAVPGPNVPSNPGVGPTVLHTNTATVATATDATGATGNGDNTNPNNYSGAQASASVTVASADLQIVKTHVGSEVPGTDVTWNLSVTNLGPDSSAGPQTVVDVLPSTLTFKSYSSADWTCVNSGPGAGSTVTCTHTGALALNANTSISLTTTIDPNATGTLSNTAMVAGTTYDPVPGNNTSTDTAPVAPSADLQITKTEVGTPVAGQPATWNLHVVNNGPSASNGPIVVDDPLPTTVSNAVVTAPGWSCTISPATGPGQDVNCTWTGTLGVGQAIPTDISITATVASSATGNLVNTATVNGQVPDPNPSNNTSTTTNPIATSADLSITKTHTGTLVPGQPLDWTLQVHNAGPSDAVNPHVTDNLPASLWFVGASGSGWTCAPGPGNTVSCDLATPLAAGTDAPPLVITTGTLSNTTGSVVNNASVMSTTPDPNLANNVTSDNATAVPTADLALTKTHTGTVVAGGTVTYNLGVTNNGPSDDPGPLTITDTMPAGFTYVPGTTTPWTCAATGTATTGQTLTCTYPGGLVTGATAPALAVTASVDPSVPASTPVNTAVVTGGAVDPNPSNNTATDPTPITVLTDLSLTKTASAPSFNSGVSPAGSFTLTVTNNGPSTSAGPVQVVDTLPTGLTYVSAVGTGWTCSAAAQVVTCTSSDTIAVGAMAAPITVTVGTNAGVGDPAPVTLTNTATVSTTPGQDTNPNNDTATASVSVAATADLSITKTHPVDPVTAGQQVPFAITVSNAGPSPAHGPLTVVDHLPTGMSYVSAAAPWTCAASGQDVTCTLSQNLAAGASAPVLTLTTLVASSVPAGSLTNTATVSSTTPDPNTENNTATDTVHTVTSADLAIVKTHVGTATINKPLTYTLTVTNNGPSDATNAVVKDAMPSTLLPQSATGTGWTCTVAGQNVECTIPTLAAGATSVITVVADVQPTGAYGITNTATVSSDTTDPNLTNNTSTDTIKQGDVNTFDLTLVKSVSDYNPSAKTASYLLQVSNIGKATHTGKITVVDTLPAGLVFVSGQGTHWTVTHNGQTVTAVTTQTLAPNTHATPLTINTSVTATPGTQIENFGTVSGGAGDINLGNNKGGATITVQGALPHTGADNSMNFVVGGLLLAAFGVVLFARRRPTTE